MTDFNRFHVFCSKDIWPTNIWSTYYKKTLIEFSTFDWLGRRLIDCVNIWLIGSWLGHSLECLSDWVFVSNWLFSIQFLFTNSIQINKLKNLFNHLNQNSISIHHFLYQIKSNNYYLSNNSNIPILKLQNHQTFSNFQPCLKMLIVTDRNKHTSLLRSGMVEKYFKEQVLYSQNFIFFLT